MHVYAQMENREQTIASEVAAAIAQSGRSDRFFVDLFGVNQSTVSRLRSGKIKKAQKYRDLLGESGLIGNSPSGLAADQIQELVAVAEQHAPLRQLLASLHNFVHNSMHK